MPSQLLGLRVGGHLALNLQSSDEPGELSQWHRNDDSTINIVIGIIVIIITTTVLRPFFRTTRVSQCQKRTSGLYGARGD